MRSALEPLVLLGAFAACSRERTSGPVDAGSADTPVASAEVPDARPTAPADAAPVTLDDRCQRHDDCVAVFLYPEGDLRCCIACGAQTAATKSSADAFVARCARERAMRDCPVYDCIAPQLDPRCVGGRCLLAPRPR